MMNGCAKALNLTSKSNCFQLRAALFHSTLVLERGRPNYWNSAYGSRRRFRQTSSNYSSRRSIRKAKGGRQSLMQNFNDYVNHMFQRWYNDFDEEDSPSSGDTSWFKKSHSKGMKMDWTHNQETNRSSRRGFQFCEDDGTFRSTFSRSQYYYWSFINEENPQWRSSSDYSNNCGRNCRYRVKHDYDFSSDSEGEFSSDSESSESGSASDRLALGLRAYGPLKLEDVKIAYRACALKWHPDRHQGPSKAVAEEKFKACSAAYQSLCDKLTAA